ncbi:MAG: hypothetical protein K8S13_23720, partial [Desulfobacula sp.]|uniref:hypothetical protein n=1 Tax=Desulfobacula sp. TaxID=2593537 RepID=UPI0025C1AFE1
MIRNIGLKISILVIVLTVWTLTAFGADWPMKQKDMHNTGRAEYTVPEDRLNDTFFDDFLWQTAAPGNLSSTSMSFFDGAGPESTDIVVGTYHWPKGIQGMDRHTGKKFWSGNPEGGESIAKITPAFSLDGSTIYVTNDSTGTPSNPLMAFSSQTGPATFRHNGLDVDPSHLSVFSPTIAPDGRIFLHKSGDRPYGGTDNGSDITQTWAAETPLNEGASDPALYQDTLHIKVIAAGLGGSINA